MQETAALLLSKLTKEPGLEERLGPYLRSLPAPNTTVFCKALFTKEHAQMLQTTDMVSICSP